MDQDPKIQLAVRPPKAFKRYPFPQAQLIILRNDLKAMIGIGNYGQMRHTVPPGSQLLLDLKGISNRHIQIACTVDHQGCFSNVSKLPGRCIITPILEYFLIHS